MNDWIDTTIGAVLTFQRGFDITREAQRTGSVPVVSSSGTGSYHDTAAATGPGVVIGRKGTLGTVFYLPGDYWPHDTTLWVRDFKGNDPRFVYYFMTQFDTRWLDAGSANPTLNRNHLHPLPVRWPPFSHQRATADLLGALDDKIATNTAIAGTADSYLAVLFDHLGALESSSKMVTLNQVAEVNARSVKPAPEGCLRYIDIAAVSPGSFAFPDQSAWQDAPSRARREVLEGDTLWSTVRPNRRSHALNLSDDPELVASTGLAVLSPRTVGFAYLYEATRRPEFTTYLESVADGSAYPAVRADRFNDAPVLLMSDPCRSRFGAVATPLRRYLWSLAEENRALAATRDALLPSLMSGRLRVKDAEQIVSDQT